MQPPQTPQDRAKRAAGAEAIRRYLKNGMKIGLGSGSTSHWFVRILGERVKEGLEVTGVPTSSSTRDIAREVGVPLADLNDIAPLDLAIDGADEIDGHGRMIKGGGASLLWEKIVACASAKMVAIVDEGKLVNQLGRFPLSVEVVRFGWRSTERHLQNLFNDSGFQNTNITLRGGLENPLVTDSGNYILDCGLRAIPDPESLARRLSQTTGVVEHGLFIGIAKEMIVGHADETAEVRVIVTS
jgi:ribose 5-phosphate isomerase A